MIIGVLSEYWKVKKRRDIIYVSIPRWLNLTLEQFPAHQSGLGISCKAQHREVRMMDNWQSETGNYSFLLFIKNTIFNPCLGIQGTLYHDSTTTIALQYILSCVVVTVQTEELP